MLQAGVRRGKRGAGDQHVGPDASSGRRANTTGFLSLDDFELYQSIGLPGRGVRGYVFIATTRGNEYYFEAAGQGTLEGIARRFF
jgi:hypothetical protein